MYIKNSRNIADLQSISKKNANPIYNFIKGGADDEQSLNRNISAFNDYSLTSNYLKDVSKIDTKRWFWATRFECH